MPARRTSLALMLLLGLMLVGAGISLALGGGRVAAPVFTSAPAARTTATTAAFAYRTSVRQSVYRCSLDGSRYRRCGARRVIAGLKPGAHTFCVTAVRGRQQSAARCHAWMILPATNVIAPPAKEGASPAPAGAVAAQTFTISGAAAGALLPGGAAVPVELTLTNPNGVPITVTDVAMRVTGAVPSGCAAAIVVAQQLAAAVVVPAQSTRTLSALGVPADAWPRLAMIDTQTDQSACQRAAIELGFTGSAEG